MGYDEFTGKARRSFGGAKVTSIKSKTPTGRAASGKAIQGRNGTISRRKDPFFGFRFIVEIEGIIVGGFQSISGLSVELDVEEIKEGGKNSFVHRIPSGVKYSDLVFERGMVDQDSLLVWYKNIVEGGPVVKRSGSIRVVNEIQETIARWDFVEAYPIKWSGSGLDAEKATIMTESITLAHHGLFRSK